ncbi:MAG: hypothetical protein AB7U41_03615 [Dongiaceae bacterium]
MSAAEAAAPATDVLGILDTKIEQAALNEILDFMRRALKFNDPAYIAAALERTDSFFAPGHEAREQVQARANEILTTARQKLLTDIVAFLEGKGFKGTQDTKQDATPPYAQERGFRVPSSRSR